MIRRNRLLIFDWLRLCQAQLRECNTSKSHCAATIVSDTSMMLDDDDDDGGDVDGNHDDHDDDDDG